MRVSVHILLQPLDSGSTASTSSRCRIWISRGSQVASFAVRPAIAPRRVRSRSSNEPAQRIRCHKESALPALPRACWTGIVPENGRLSALIVNVLCLDREMSLQTGGKGRAIAELDMNFRAIHAIFVDGDEADDFIGQFFAVDHDYLVLSSRAHDAGPISALTEDFIEFLAHYDASCPSF